MTFGDYCESCAQSLVEQMVQDEIRADAERNVAEPETRLIASGREWLLTTGALCLLGWVLFELVKGVLDSFLLERMAN